MEERRNRKEEYPNNHDPRGLQRIRSKPEGQNSGFITDSTTPSSDVLEKNKVDA